MPEWIFLMHPDRDDFMATMAEPEQEAFAAHAQWLQELFDEGHLIISGPCLGPVNTGVLVFEAPDEAAARQLVADEPVTRAGIMTADLRPFRMGFLRGRP